ncbi:MAG: GNAT family N-acetyltransferase, partial [Alistipes sp.]
MKYREATRDDVSRIMQIIRQAQAQMRALGSTQWQDNYPAVSDIEHDIAYGYGIVACDSISVIGYAAMLFNGEPAYANIEGAWLSTGDYVVVHRLAIADEVKRRGTATAFMRHVEE